MTQKYAIIWHAKYQNYAGYRNPPQIISLAVWLHHDLDLASVTSKNCYWQKVLTSVAKRSEIDVVNSGKGIAVKLGYT